MCSLILSLLLFFALLSPLKARGEPLLIFSGGAGYSGHAEEGRNHGFYSELGLGHPLNDFWVLQTQQRFAAHGIDSPLSIHQSSLGLRYHLDVFEYIPWLSLAPIFLWTPAELEGWGLDVALGLDWMLTPECSLGILSRYQSLFAEEAFPALLMLGTQLSYRWTLDPFED